MYDPSQLSNFDFSTLNLSEKMDNITEAVYCLSIDGDFLYLNQTCADLLKINRQDAIGKPAKDFAPEVLLNVGAESNKHAESNGYHVTEICYDQQWFRFIKVKIHLRDQEQDAIITIVKDVTKKKSKQLDQLKNMYSVNAELIDSQNLLAQIDVDTNQFIAPYSVILCDIEQANKHHAALKPKIIDFYTEKIKETMYVCLAGRECWIYNVDSCFLLIINSASEGEIFFLRDYIEKTLNDEQNGTPKVHINFGSAHVKGSDETFMGAIDAANRQLYLNKYQNKVNFTLNDHAANLELKSADSTHNQPSIYSTVDHLTAHEKEIFFDKIFHTSSNLFVLIKPDATICAANDTTYRLSGYTPEELLGRSLSDFLPNFISNKEYLTSLLAVKQNGFWEGESCFQGKDKKVYVFYSRFNATYDAEGQLEYIVATAQDYTTIRNKQAELQQVAYFDPLTNLPNEHCFNLMLSEKILHADIDEEFAVIFMDIDNFQDINDMYGYKMGSLALKSIAIRLQLFFGKNALLSRISGDHFIATVKQSSKNDILHYIEKLQESFSNELPIDYTHNTSLKINTGISLFPKDGRTAEALINKANIAVNNVKKEPLKYTAIFDPQMTEISQKALRIKNLIIDGLKYNYFSLVYQPKIELNTNKISGYEVYLRLFSPSDNEEISPEEFIPIAERMGLINQINEWVIREVSIKGSKFYTEDKLKGKISINLSTTQLQDRDFIDSLVDIFRFSDMPIHNISFDIKDDISDNNQKTIIDNIQRLDKMGVALCVDSYGIRHSYFTTLTELPIKKIKINKKYVSQLDRNIKALAITKAICALAITLKIDIIAVGVENINQAEILKSLGCSEAQGFYYTSPRPFDDL